MTTEETPATSTPDANSKESDKNTPSNVSELGPFDVLCGRDRKCSSNEGNRRFRHLINANLPRYLNCDSKFERSKTIGAICMELQKDPNGSIRFFKRVKGSDCNDDNASIEMLNEKQSREKVAHALRDYAAQRRNAEAKQQSMAIAVPPMPLNPGLSASPKFHRDQFIDNTGSSSQGQGQDDAPSLTRLMEEAARVKAQIAALQHSENPSLSAPYQGSLNAPTRIDGPGDYNNYIQAYTHQGQNNEPAQYGQYRQTPQEDDNEGSEGYDDFNLDDYAEFIQPMGTGSSRAPAQQSDNQQHYQQQQPRLVPLKQSSEGYDNFNDRVEPRRAGRSLRHLEKSGSNKSMKSQGSLRLRESFERKSQGSLGHMDVFESSSGSNRMLKGQGSLRHMEVFDKALHRSSSKSHESLGATELMTMSMETLTLNESDMNESAFTMGDSILGFDQSKFDLSMQQSKLDLSMQQSKLDMSLQQSKLDMSCQTIDTADILGQKRTSTS